MSVQPQRWVEVVSHLDPRYGGLSAAVPAMGKRIAERSGIDVSLAAFCAPAEHFHPAGFDKDQITFWPAARKPWLSDFVSGNSLRSALKQQLSQADGVHIHGLWEQSTAVTASVASDLKIPYILSAHGMLEPWALNNKRLKKFVYSVLVERANVQSAGCLHALSQTEAEQYLAFGARSAIAIIPNGVDIPRTRNPELFLRTFPDLRRRRIVLFLGRLHPKKGLDLLLEAWCGIAERYPDAHLVLAGPDCDGTLSRLQQFLHEHCLFSSVSIVGMLHDAMKWSALAAAESFVLPSFSEGLSISVLEAMGMALPVIITTACNMPEVKKDRLGWVIEPTLDELHAALDAMLSCSVDENHDTGLRAAALIAEKYTWDRTACSMAEVYRWLTGGPEPTSVKLFFPRSSHAPK